MELMSNSRGSAALRRWSALGLMAGRVWGGHLSAQLRGDYQSAPGREKTWDLISATTPAERKKNSDNKNEVRAHRNAVLETLKGDKDAPLGTDGEKDLVKWYSTYEFPILTLYRPDELALLPEQKTDLY